MMPRFLVMVLCSLENNTGKLTKALTNFSLYRNEVKKKNESKIFLFKMNIQFLM